MSRLGEAIAANDSAWATCSLEEYDGLVEQGVFSDPSKTYQVERSYGDSGELTGFHVRNITLYTWLRDLKTPVAVAVYLGGVVVVFLWAQRRYLDAFDELAGAVTGLVLSIVEEIARAHGGRVWVESDGGTTTFTVELSG
ncbi:hypothetical protein AAK967_06080 [Atopobiaceae bacterium 24-176]